MTSKPILYYIDASPPSRSVLLTAAAIGLELDLKVVDLMNGEQLTPEFIKVHRSTKQKPLKTEATCKIIQLPFNFS